MKLTLDNGRLRSLIPNIIHEVEGETPLFDKLLPWLTSARLWMEKHIIGDFQPENEIYELTEKIIVFKAYAEAVPSLDVSLSPAGFAVINTDGRAPASKERVERLVAYLNSFVDLNLAALVRELHHSPDWAASPLGRWFRASFIPDFTDVPRFRTDKDIITTYKAMRSIALAFERELEEKYLGHDFLEILRSSYPKFEKIGALDMFDAVRVAELRYISFHFSDNSPKGLAGQLIWQLARTIVARLDIWPELKELWEREMGEKIKVEPFKNTVRGGFYF